MKYLILCLMMFISSNSHAEDILLNWDIPLSREDDTTLNINEIDGYRIYYGNSPSVYNTTIWIADNSSNSFTIADLPYGEYYIAMTTVDTGGRESVLSGEKNVSVDSNTPLTVKKIYLR